MANDFLDLDQNQLFARYVCVCVCVLLSSFALYFILSLLAAATENQNNNKNSQKALEMPNELLLLLPPWSDPPLLANWYAFYLPNGPLK